MTPEKHLVIPMSGSLYMLLSNTPLGSTEASVTGLIDTIISITKLMTFGDVAGIDKQLIEYYKSIANDSEGVSFSNLNNVIRESALTFMHELVVEDLIDHILYVVDYTSTKIVLRAYKLDTSIDTTKGVEDVF